MDAWALNLSSGTVHAHSHTYFYVGNIINGCCALNFSSGTVHSNTCIRTYMTTSFWMGTELNFWNSTYMHTYILTVSGNMTPPHITRILTLSPCLHHVTLYWIVAREHYRPCSTSVICRAQGRTGEGGVTFKCLHLYKAPLNKMWSLCPPPAYVPDIYGIVLSTLRPRTWAL
jgi:hypothetical protein